MLIFESCNGFPVPRLARDGSGAERQPDDIRFFDIEQAAARFNAPVEALEQLHADFFADLIAADAPRDAPVLSEDAALAVLHATRFPELKPQDFDAVMLECHRRRLNPWGRQVWASYKWNNDRKRNDLIIGTTIEGFRAIAHGTGQCAGIDNAIYDYGDDERAPVKAVVAVYRLIGGRKRKFLGEALWDECSVPGDEFWTQRPCLMLAKCAEAAAHRKAFPELCGGLYERCEISPTTGPRLPRPVTPPAPVVGDDVPPLTRFRFELELVDLGFGNAARRNALVEGFRVKWAGRYDADPAVFYAEVLRAVRANPKAYGGDALSG